MDKRENVCGGRGAEGDFWREFESGSYLQILQHKRTMFPKRFDQAEDARILGGDAVGNGRRDANDFLEHLDKAVVFVLARFDLAGLHAEGGFEVHSLHSVVVLAVCTCVDGRREERVRGKQGEE